MFTSAHGLSLRAIYLLMIIASCLNVLRASDAAYQLYEDIFAKSEHMSLIRPRTKTKAPLPVKLKVKLSQIIAVHEKNQVMTSSVWLYHEWIDPKLVWDPHKYDNIESMYVPAESIWVPDTVLYNNADGDYQIRIMTKATVYFNGTVIWEPPAIYKSMCDMNIRWFPFDEQICHLKFGSWAYDGSQVQLVHYHGSELISVRNTSTDHVQYVHNAVDLSAYYPNIEWDLMAVPAERNSKTYPCCTIPFVDITYYVHIRRRTLFYTVNLLIPCVGISFLTILVFYLPSNSYEKVGICMSIFVALNVFLLLLVDIVPSTSLEVPLIGRYLIFTMVMVTLSIVITVATLNIHYQASNSEIPHWVRWTFIETLPRILRMERPDRRKCAGKAAYPEFALIAQKTIHEEHYAAEKKRQEARRSKLQNLGGSLDSVAKSEAQKPHQTQAATPSVDPKTIYALSSGGCSWPFQITGDVFYLPPQPQQSVDSGVAMPCCRGEDGQPLRTRDSQRLIDAAKSVTFIATKMYREHHQQLLAYDWQFVAMVIDRLFLWFFAICCIVGTCSIILEAPLFYDTRRELQHGSIAFIPRATVEVTENGA